jgi:predicted NBD/HSP70 family sugar kinase
MPTLTPKHPVRLSRPEAPRISEHHSVLSAVARLVASGAARTRSQIVRETGLARSSVSAALDSLIRGGILVETGEESAGRGRPAGALAMSADIGVVLVADLSPGSIQIAIAHVDQELVVREQIALDITDGPVTCLETVSAHFMYLLKSHGLTVDDVRALVLSLPGPVDIRRGVPVRPPIMPGWDEYPVADVMSERFGCPALVDNDVNLMALAEVRTLPLDQLPLLMIAVGTGIGGGMIMASGDLHHGADGAACDIGHIRVPNGEAIVCNCGNVGCVEAIASAEAITRQLRTVKRDESLTQLDLERLVREGDSEAIYLVRDAARTIGGVVAMLVHVFNPARIIIVGELTAASDDILAGVRSVVYQSALPLATRNLSLTHGVLGSSAALTGGLIVGIERVLSPEGIGELLTVA